MLKIVMIMIIMGVVPLVLGSYLEEKLLPMYLVGFSVMLFLFQVLCVPLLFLHISFTVLCAIYWGIIAALCIGAVICGCGKKVIEDGKRTPQKIKQINIMLVLAFGIIVVQAARMVIKTPYIYGDDVTYLAMVNDILSTDKLYSLNAMTGNEIPLESVSHKYLFTSYYPFLAAIAKVINLHPLILCKTVLPIFYISMSYFVIWMLSEKLFQKNTEKRGIFFLLYTILIEFGNYTYYTLSRRVLIWNWNGKSVLFTIILPLVFYYGIQFMEGSVGRKEKRIVFLMEGAAVSTTLMGAGMAPILLSVMALIGTIKNKNIRIFISGICCCIPAIGIVILDVLYRMVIKA